MPAPASSCVRFGVVGFMLALGAVTYLDRACIAALGPEIQRDMGLSKEQMSWVFSAFAVAYAAFEIPTAWWADRVGTRRVLTRIVLWWSAFTMATAAAWSLASMMVIRFLFGAGEAGAWPNVARTFSRWIPRTERGRVQGIFFAAAHGVGGLTPLIALGVAGVCGWRWTFVIFGLPGIVWALAWYRWFRDDPEQHPAVQPAELEKIVAGRDSSAGQHEGWAYWKQLLKHPNTLFLCLMYFPNSFGFYFCITWLPAYLREQHGFDSMRLGFYAGLPLILSIVADLLGGWATDAATRRFGLRIGRAGVGALSYLMAALGMFLATVAGQPELAAWCLALGVAASMFTLGASWGAVMDVGGSHTAMAGAAMNTAGQIGSIACPLLVVWLQQKHDWNAPLYLIGSLFLVGAAAWLFINPRRKIFE